MPDYRPLSPVPRSELGFVAGLLQLAKLCSLLLYKNLWIYKSWCCTPRSVRITGGWGNIYFSAFLAGTWKLKPDEVCISLGSSLSFFETKWPYLNPCNLNTWSVRTLWMTPQNILSFSIARKGFLVSFIADNTGTAEVWEYFIWWSPCLCEKILLI